MSVSNVSVSLNYDRNVQRILQAVNRLRERYNPNTVDPVNIDLIDLMHNMTNMWVADHNRLLAVMQENLILKDRVSILEKHIRGNRPNSAQSKLHNGYRNGTDFNHPHEVQSPRLSVQTTDVSDSSSTISGGSLGESTISGGNLVEKYLSSLKNPSADFSSDVSISSSTGRNQIENFEQTLGVRHNNFQLARGRGLLLSSHYSSARSDCGSQKSNMSTATSTVTAGMSTLPTSALPSNMKVCPLNKAHVVKITRMQHHLVKCLKQYDGRKKRCPYNATEYFEPEEMEQHIINCEARKLKEGQVHYSNNCSNKFEAPFHHPDLPQSDESWGLE